MSDWVLPWAGYVAWEEAETATDPPEKCRWCRCPIFPWDDLHPALFQHKYCDWGWIR